MMKRLRRVENRRARDPVRTKQLDPFIAIPRGKCVLDHRLQNAAVCDAGGVLGKTLVVDPFASTDELRERRKQAISGEAEHDGPIGGREYAVRHDLHGSVTRTTWRASAGDILREHAVPPEKCRLQQRSLDDTALAGLRAIMQGCEDSYRRPHPGAFVDDRVGDKQWLPVGLAVAEHLAR